MPLRTSRAEKDSATELATLTAVAAAAATTRGAQPWNGSGRASTWSAAKPWNTKSTCQAETVGVTLAEPTGPCGSCSGDLEIHREEAILNLEVRSAEVPREYFDVTVRYPMPTDHQRLTVAADHDGAVNKEAERENRARYPDGRTPYRATPLALETGGRHGRAALLHLRKLARARAVSLEEDGDGDAAVSALM